MKKLSVKVNYLFNAGYQIFAIIVPIITTPYISRVLSASGIGVYSYTYSIVRYFLLIAALGTATYGIRTIGMYQEDKEKKSKYFWEIFIFRFVMSLIMLILYVWYVIQFSDDKLIALFQGIYILGVMFDVSWFFQGLENFKKIAIRNFIIKIINILYIFLFVKTKNDLWKYVLGLALFTLLGNVSIWGSLRKYIQKISLKELNPFKSTNVILQLFMPTVATQLYSVLDKSMIGWLSNSSLENGYYEQALKIIEMSLILITTLGSVLVPKISREYKNGNMENVRKYLTKSYRFVWFLSIPMMLGIVGISSILVPVFFGQGYEKDIILLPILSILYIPMGLNNITGVQYLIATGQQNKYSKFLIIGGTVNVFLNIILISKFYSIGAAIGTIIGEVVITVISFLYLQRTKQYQIKNIFKISFKYILAGLIMFFSIILLKSIMVENIISLLTIIGISIFIYFCVLIFLREELTFEGIKILKSKIKRVGE